MARSSINWLGTDLARDREAGYATSSLPLSALLEKAHRPMGTREGLPSLFFFYSALDDEKLAKFEDKVFTDERVAIGSRFFNFFRVSVDDMRSKADRTRYGKGGVSVHLLDVDGKTYKVLKGWTLTGNKVFRAMESLVKARYKKRLGRILAKEGKILAVLDETHWKIEDLKFDLAEIKTHLEKHNCQRGRRLVKELTTKIDAQKKQREKALEKERALLRPLSSAAPE